MSVMRKSNKERPSVHLAERKTRQAVERGNGA